MNRYREELAAFRHADVITKRRANMREACLRYRVDVTIDIGGESDELTYYCDTAGDAGGLREAFEKAHGTKANVRIWDQEQDRRIY